MTSFLWTLEGIQGLSPGHWAGNAWDHTTDNKIRVLNPSGQEREGEGVRQSATTFLGHFEELWLGDSRD